jgi:hypothetical protein
MFFGSFLSESASSQNLFGHPDVERCPFLRNINGASTFSFTSALPVAVRSVSYDLLCWQRSVSLNHQFLDIMWYCAGPRRQGSNF